jgi:hypothetical protein
MSHEAARILLGTALRHGAEQDAALANIRALCSQEEFDKYRQAIGKTMGAMLFELINPIVAKYPDLKPPEME